MKMQIKGGKMVSEIKVKGKLYYEKRNFSKFV